MSAKKNVLLIVVDQWRGDTLSVLGHPCLQTPNLDALCADAVTFRNHYNQRSLKRYNPREEPMRAVVSAVSPDILVFHRRTRVDCWNKMWEGACLCRQRLIGATKHHAMSPLADASQP